MSTDTRDGRTIEQNAERLRDDLEADRLIDLIDRIEDRNISVSSWEYSWDTILDNLREQLSSEHDPLSIEWHGTTSSNPAYGDAEWDVEYVDVCLGTGGPACGVEFRDADDAQVWWQDWFTTRAYASLSSATARRLAELWGIEF